VPDLSAALFAAEDGQSLAAQKPWRTIPGRLHLRPGLSVPALAVVFHPPRSYTGQPLVELHLAGSPALLEMALHASAAAGARLAEPGEFTARAFLTGRMDLLTAEAVAERIAARTDAHVLAARQMVGGTLAERSRAAGEELADVLSLVEAGIDFADEPIEFIDGASLASRLAALAASLEDLLARSLDMQRLEALPRVALAGPPNAGKSRLLNRLSGLDRSICSPIPGTTRDVLSAVMDTPAGQVLLLDGPGLGRPQSDIDRMAQKAWRDVLAQVDLVLLVLAADEVYHGTHGGEAAAYEAVNQVMAGRRQILAVNKQDLLSRDEQTALADRLVKEGHQSVHIVSAATGSGCDDLRKAIGAAVAGLDSSGQGRIVLTARHRQALRGGLDAIHAAAGHEAAELVALHLREAMTHLGQITGQVTTDDLLERVFSRFCIGK
jgi:tRNA modification GTPase